MTVSPVGGGSSATVDVNGNFTLVGVHAGSSVDLKFNGTGVNTQVSLGEIDANEDVTIRITRDGALLKLDRILRRGRDKEELEGRIDGLPPTTAAATFTISGQNVQTDTNTQFFKGSAPATFADLQVGQRVHVSGTPNANGVLAKTVRIQDINIDLEFEVEGTVSALSGTATSFQFIADGRLIKGDASTTFDDGKTFADLANGVRVEVKGQIRIGFILATKIEVR
jgi:hypothetical protein